MKQKATSGEFSERHGRRRALRTLALAAISVSAARMFGCSTVAKDGRPLPPLFREPIAAAADAAALDKPRWGADDFNAFLASLPAKDLHQLAIGLELVKPDSAPPSTAAEGVAMERAIKVEILRVSSNYFERPWKDENEIDYDGIVRWVGKKYDVEQSSVSSDSTFHVEQRVMLKIFAGIWDRLTPEQRGTLLREVDPTGSKIADSAAIVAASGTAAAALLSTTAVLSGFAFYSTMSVTISTSAALLGVTLPFAVYSTASTAVGIMTGPIGWSLLAVGSLATLIWAAGADARKCAAVVAQINTLRARAWRASGRRVPDLHQ